MKDYYMFNFSETHDIFVGSFQNDDEFWKHYWNNEIEIKLQQSRVA